MYYVYILRCGDDSLYTGITTDPARRLREHSGEISGGARYTRSHGVSGFAALWSAPDRIWASRLEYRIKHLTRERKLRLADGESLPEEFAKVCRRCDL